MPDASPIGLAWKVAVDVIPNRSSGDTPPPPSELEEESKDPRLGKDPQTSKDKKGFGCG